jgi:hypothetical protein
MRLDGILFLDLDDVPGCPPNRADVNDREVLRKE